MAFSNHKCPICNKEIAVNKILPNGASNKITLFCCKKCGDKYSDQLRDQYKRNSPRYKKKLKYNCIIV